MAENEKKLTELRDDELNDVAGGRNYGTSPTAGVRTLTCSNCGNTYKVKASALSHASCPKCGQK